MAAFLGMRGSGDWATDQRPKNWRETILHLWPNGDAPLTAMLSMLGSESVDDPEFNWWTKQLETQAGTVTGVYTDVALSSAYVSGGASGDTLYVKMASADADHFRPGHQVLLRDTSDHTVDVNAKCTARVNNGASSYIACLLLEADDNSTSNDLSDCDRALVVGNINAEGALVPDAISYDPVKWFNYTQIFRTPLEITRTNRKTRLRTGDGYKELKREALEYHSIEMEKALLFGIASESTGSNGKPERTTLGLIPAIKGGGTGHAGSTYAGTVNDFSLNTSYSAATWLQKGEEWLDEQLELIFRYGRSEKMCFIGSGALLGINRLVKNNGDFSFNSKTTSYGIQVVEWTTPFGVIFLKRHPLFSHEVTNRNSMVIFEPQGLKQRTIDDTTFFDDPPKKNTGHTRQDGQTEEFLTEIGLEYHHPIGWGYLNGVGVDNTV